MNDLNQEAAKATKWEELLDLSDRINKRKAELVAEVMASLVHAARLQAGWREDAYAIIHRSSAKDDPPWRVSFFDKDGASGHSCRATAQECVELAVSDGYGAIVAIR